MSTTTTAPNAATLLGAFPPAGRRRLLAVASAWALVALTEAAAYTVLALGIVHQWPAWGALAAAGVAVAAGILTARAGYRSGVRLAGDLYAAVGAALGRARLGWFTEPNRALVTRAAGQGIPAMMAFPAHQLQAFVVAPVLPLALTGSIAIVAGPFAAGCAAALLIAALGLQTLAQRRLARADADRHGLEEDAEAATIELVEHLELLRTAGPATRTLARAEAAWTSREAALARTNRAAAPATLLSALASALPLAGAIVLLAATGGLADPAPALALLVLVGRASAPIDELALAGITVGALRGNTIDYRRIISAPVLRQPVDPATPSGTGYELRGVTAAPALHGLTASIPAGSTAQITGPSGAGKSTLLGLLMRFDDPADGSVALGGVPLSDVDEDGLARMVAYVPQEPVVFTGTLESNIRLGRPDASEAELVAAIRDAGLAEVLARDPAGLRQEVGRHGAALSGGERQRVAIARALVKGAPILILDEATSALDAETEGVVVSAVARRTGTTVILVTHRDGRGWEPDLVIELGAARMR